MFSFILLRISCGDFEKNYIYCSTKTQEKHPREDATGCLLHQNSFERYSLQRQEQISFQKKEKVIIFPSPAP